MQLFPWTNLRQNTASLTIHKPCRNYRRIMSQYKNGYATQTHHQHHQKLKTGPINSWMRQGCPYLPFLFICSSWRLSQSSEGEDCLSIRDTNGEGAKSDVPAFRQHTPILTRNVIRHCWERTLLQPLWRALWRFLKRPELEAPCGPAAPVLGIDLKSAHSRHYLPWVLSLFTIALPWNPPALPLTSRWTGQETRASIRPQRGRKWFLWKENGWDRRALWLMK